MASDDDHHLARDLAVVAGHRLVDLRARGGTPDELRKAGDVVLSEEGADDPARLSADRVWIVDPLDGTREFGEAGRTDWAVHVALWERAQGGLSAGAVALPAQDEVLSTVNPPPLPADPPSQPYRIVVSRSRPASFLPRMAELAGADLDPLGSAGAKVAAVLTGVADAYVHAGGQYEWDSAAPVAVARAAGFHASRIDGSELSYNQPDLLMPDILVCPPTLAGALLDAIRTAQS
jgi:3'(2'), 5'-bisphosphate nucleotidase